MMKKLFGKWIIVLSILYAYGCVGLPPADNSGRLRANYTRYFPKMEWELPYGFNYADKGNGRYVCSSIIDECLKISPQISIKKLGEFNKKLSLYGFWAKYESKKIRIIIKDETIAMPITLWLYVWNNVNKYDNSLKGHKKLLSLSSSLGKVDVIAGTQYFRNDYFHQEVMFSYLELRLFEKNKYGEIEVFRDNGTNGMILAENEQPEKERMGIDNWGILRKCMDDKCKIKDKIILNDTKIPKTKRIRISAKYNLIMADLYAYIN